MAAGLPRETVDHGEAEAGALADRLGREERLEHLGGEFGGHADAGVGHAEGEILARRHVVARGGMAVEPFVVGLDRDAAAVGHGVAGVDAEVQQRVLELWRVDQSRPQPRRAHHFNGDGGADGPADEVLHAAHQHVDVRRAGIERLPPRKGEQAMRQCRGATRGTLRCDHVAIELGDPALPDAQRHQLEAAGNAGEQIVEIVRQAAGELAHRLHLLRLA